MKYIRGVVLLGVLLAFSNISFAIDAREEILKLGRDIGRFEKDVPFFTKSKLAVFFSFEKSDFDGAFYGLYINDNLAKTGLIDMSAGASRIEIYIGDFPVKSGENMVTAKFSKDSAEVVKKFQIEIPEYRRIAVEFLFAGSLIKPRATPRAWVIE